MLASWLYFACHTIQITTYCDGVQKKNIIFCWWCKMKKRWHQFEDGNNTQSSEMGKKKYNNIIEIDGIYDGVVSSFLSSNIMNYALKRDRIFFFCYAYCVYKEIEVFFLHVQQVVFYVICMEVILCKQLIDEFDIYLVQGYFESINDDKNITPNGVPFVLLLFLFFFYNHYACWGCFRFVGQFMLFPLILINYPN